MYAQEVLRAQLHRRQRVLDFVGHLAGHFSPGLEAMRAFELTPLGIQLDRHLVEVGLEDLQLVRRPLCNALFQHGRAAGERRRLKLPAGHTARRAGQALYGVRDAAGDRPADEADHGDEEQRGSPHAAVQLVDLAFDLLLPGCEGHRQDRVSPGCPNRGGGQLIPQRSNRVLTDEAGELLEGDGAIDHVRGPGRKETGGIQVSLAGRHQLRTVEEVDVLADDLTDPERRR